MSSLQSLHLKLKATLKDEASLRMVNSRLILRTGINLIDPAPAQTADPHSVERVLGALRDMGFDIN